MARSASSTLPAYGRDATRLRHPDRLLRALPARDRRGAAAAPRRRRDRRRLRHRAVLPAAPASASGPRARSSGWTRRRTCWRSPPSGWPPPVGPMWSSSTRPVEDADAAGAGRPRPVLRGARRHAVRPRRSTTCSARVRPGGGVAAGGGKWGPAWAIGLNAGVLALHAPYVRDFTGFDRPWTQLAARVPGLRRARGGDGRRLRGLRAAVARGGSAEWECTAPAGPRRGDDGAVTVQKAIELIGTGDSIQDAVTEALDRARLTLEGVTGFDVQHISGARGGHPHGLPGRAAGVVHAAGTHARMTGSPTRVGRSSSRPTASPGSRCRSG